MKSRRGITLVALVITIIVLLILAGITISLTIGQQGILRRAEEAGKNYMAAAQVENKQLLELTNQTDKIITGIWEEEYTMVEGVPVPKGFTHIEGSIDTGFVVRDTSVDELGNPTKTNGNEFVWVPCTLDGANGSVKYDRYDFGKQCYPTTYQSYSESLVDEERTSIERYEGFYIGRYEVGIEGHDEKVDEIAGGDGTLKWTGYHNGRAVVQPNKQVWNWITRDKAKEVVEDMYKDNDTIISKICSSYAWDTTLKFIAIKNPTYVVESPQGNYSGTLKKTGQTEAVNHIYDMGGNVWEWTLEDVNGPSGTYVIRGGEITADVHSYPASFRHDASKTNAYSTMGMRNALFIKVFD